MGFSQTPDTVSTSSGEVIGAVGELISALLQTAGVYGQGQVINTFSPVLNEIGALVYTVAVIGAIISVALFGNYRKAVYLIMGPALFTWMLTATVPAAPTLLRYGKRISNNGAQQIAILQTFSSTGTFSSAPEVSQFFALFDSVVSEVVQATVSLIVDTENNSDLLIAARERVFSRALAGQATDSSYVRLVSLGAMGDCGKVQSARMRIAQLKDAQPGTPEYSERTRLIAEAQRLRNEPAGHLDISLRQYIAANGGASLTADDVVTCEELWTFTVEISRIKARELIEELADEAVHLSGNTGEEAYNLSREDVLREVRLAMLGIGNGEYGEGGGEPDPAIVNEILAAYVLKNTMVNSTHGQMTRSTFNHMPFERNQYDFIFRNSAAHYPVGDFTKIAYFAGTIPYVQGLLLLLLASAFPFFAVLLLLPGRATSFFIWAGLWVWVKSWDVGFAVIYFVRDLLWEFIRKQANDTMFIGSTDSWASEVSGNFSWTNPESIFYLMAENDPLANYHLYFNTVALLTLSVPFFTGHLCLGATGMFQNFTTHIDKAANRFGIQAQNFSKNSMVGHYDKAHADYVGQRQVAAANAELARRQANGTYGDKNDATDGRAANEAYEKEGFAAHFGDQAALARMQISTLTGRKMTYSAGQGQSLVMADANQRFEQDLLGNSGFGSWSLRDTDRADSSDTDIGVGKGSDGAKGMEGGDGD